jgi:hypothetical protein
MGRGGTERGVNPVSKPPPDAPPVGSAKMRRFVWPLAECLEASRPVKSRDFLKYESLWVFCSPVPTAVLETA